MLLSFCFQQKLVLRPQDRQNVCMSPEGGIASLNITKSTVPGLTESIVYRSENTKRCFSKVNQLP